MASLDPVEGGLVRFLAPTEGASAALSTRTRRIGAGGRARCFAKANGTVGAYHVTATAEVADAPVAFRLTNT